MEWDARCLLMRNGHLRRRKLGKDLKAHLFSEEMSRESSEDLWGVREGGCKWKRENAARIRGDLAVRSCKDWADRRNEALRKRDEAK